MGREKGQGSIVYVVSKAVCSDCFVYCLVASVLLLSAIKHRCQCFNIVSDQASVEPLAIHSCQVHASLHFVHLPVTSKLFQFQIGSNRKYFQ